MNKIFKIVISLLIIFVIIAGVRFLIGGAEDDWICDNGEWVKHGSPSAPMPSEPCSDENNDEQVFCTMDAKVCPDGSFVSRVAPDCHFEPCPKEDLITVEYPVAGREIFSPLHIKGEARGYWFFEGDFPIKLLDGGGDVLATGIAHAQGDWMTEDFVPFEAEISFDYPDTNTGKIIFEKDNPSGLEKNADELVMPISFPSEDRDVILYYYNPDIDKDSSGNIKCSSDGLVSVQREIPLTKTPIQDTINLLISGEITDEESSFGASTEFPLDGFSLKGASLKDGVLKLEFEDPNNKTVGGSCRTGILWQQIRETAEQFDGVEKVEFLPEELFQP